MYQFIYASLIWFQQFRGVVNSFHPSPTDSVQLGGCNTVIACLPNTGSRHNAPMSPHALTQMMRSGLCKGNQENVVVCNCLADFILFCAEAIVELNLSEFCLLCCKVGAIGVLFRTVKCE